MFSISVFASSFSATWSIPNGSDEWSGKSNHLWLFSSTDEATFSASITNTTHKNITAELWQIRVFLPDSKILSLSISGANGASGSTTFTPQTSNSYYAKIKNSDKTGANGTVRAAND